MATSVPQVNSSQAPSVSTRPYRYNQLSRRHIRLLRIISVLDEPGLSTTITISLEAFALDNAPPYDALSYAWDPSAKSFQPTKNADPFERPSRIYCDQNEIMITSSLKWTLQNLATEKFKTEFESCNNAPNSAFLWADGICINQDDVHERAAQVALMAEVYNKAAWVLVTVGHPVDWPILEDGIAMASMLGRSCRDIEANFPSHRREQLWNDQFWTDVTGHTPTVPEWTSWVVLMSMPIFHRVWTLQEIFLAGPDKAILVSEFICRRLQYVLLSLRFVMLTYWAPQIHDAIMPNLRRLTCLSIDLKHVSAWMLSLHPYATILECWRTSTIPSLLELARAVYPHVMCQDPHDRIYGALGIAAEFRDRDETLLPVDYTMPVAEVFARATRHIVAHSGSLSILSAVEARHDDSKLCDIKMPSWCPDFGLRQPRPQELLSYRLVDTTQWRACKTSRATASVSDKNPWKLHVRGKRFDTVSKHVHRIHDPGRPQNSSQILHSLFKLTIGDPPARVPCLLRTLCLHGLLQPGTNLFEISDPRNLAQWICLMLAAMINNPDTITDEYLNDHILPIIEMIKTYVFSSTSNPLFPSTTPQFLQNELLLRITAPKTFSFESALARAKDIHRTSCAPDPATHDPWNIILSRLPVYFSHLNEILDSRAVFRTFDHDMFAMGHETVKEGDEIWALAGGKVPFVLRPRQATPATGSRNGAHGASKVLGDESGLAEYEFVGEVHVDGIMFGEMWPVDETVLEDIVLV